ncbi:MAG: DUF2905 domain-containing protein [Chloroflexi bacterium]|nr:DUF2905 domain-containing protein [Chloroflexota bacterium]
MEVSSLGRWLIVLGGLLALAGVLLVVAGKVPLLGRLPGDVVLRRDGLTILIPLATMLLVSLALTLLLNVVGRFWR